MASLLKNVSNSILHAFNALQQEKPGFVNKSKLKVLTANIAVILDLYGVERGLDQYRSTSTLNFDHFKYYLMKEVFLSVPEDMTLAQQRNFETRIEEVCWLVCRKDFCSEEGVKVYTADMVFKLFRIFCMLADQIEAQDSSLFCAIAGAEALHIVQQLLSSLGLDYETDNRFEYLSNTDTVLTFSNFLQLIDFQECTDIKDCREPLKEAVEDMYQTYIMDVIKKGYLLKRGYLLPTLREYWFVLQPCELSYYKHSNEKELCGTIHLDSKSSVRPCISNNGKHEKVQKFVVSFRDRVFELAAMDHRSRMQWISALQLAITYSTGKDGFQRDIASRRKIQRDIENKRKKEEERLKSSHIKQVEETKEQLEKERHARLAAETQARQLEALAREDSRRVAELEDMKMTLEKLLEEESQAKRDEEIVRALQARVLAEEWEKREELEQLQEDQKTILEQERQKRIEFEVLQKEKEQQLKDAERRLKQLEEERERLDEELRYARQKIQHSEETKELMEARLQAISPRHDGDRVRRVQSFMSSTRERPVTIESRLPTLKRPSKVQ
ncbi:differentially expressed in FDCP 6 homolog [Culicoides brevitarsis]|uniref:differentially expressed in FDCP 6 homolog n=1 Tax=Culicoides brevitarsis TaxID=469753 RepID=UPI00307C87C3